MKINKIWTLLGYLGFTVSLLFVFSEAFAGTPQDFCTRVWNKDHKSGDTCRWALSNFASFGWHIDENAVQVCELDIDKHADIATNCFGNLALRRAGEYNFTPDSMAAAKKCVGNVHEASDDFRNTPYRNSTDCLLAYGVEATKSQKGETCGQRLAKLKQDVGSIDASAVTSTPLKQLILDINVYSVQPAARAQSSK